MMYKLVTRNGRSQRPGIRPSLETSNYDPPVSSPDEPLDCGFLSLPAELQAALLAGPLPSGRTRIEIVADDLGRPVTVDYEADMAYFEVRALHPGEYVHRTDLTRESDGVLTDHDANGELLGVEVFLVDAGVRPETIAELERLLSG